MKTRPYFASIDDAVVGEGKLSPRVRRWLSLMALGFAVFLGCQDYTSPRPFWFDKTFSLTPDMRSGVFAISLVSALYVRRLLVFRGTIYCLISFALNVTITAILMQALLGQAAPWTTRFPMPYLICFAIVSAWTGMREIAQVSWLAAVCFGLINLGFASDALKLQGYFLVLLVAVGVILQADFSFDSSKFRENLRGGTSAPDRRKRVDSVFSDQVEINQSDFKPAA